MVEWDVGRIGNRRLRDVHSHDGATVAQEKNRQLRDQVAPYQAQIQKGQAPA